MQNLHILKFIKCNLFFCFFSFSCFSQVFLNNSKYQFEAGAYLSTSRQIPFWLRSNQYGIVPLESQVFTLKGAIYKEYDSTKKKQNKLKNISYGYGLNTVINVGNINQLLLPEAYIKVRYGPFEFYGGRRKEIVGLVDTMLTSGSYIWSGNSLPLPKIQLSIPNFVSIFGTDLISIKGTFAHGWFGNGDSVKKYFLHQKLLYARLGKPNWKIKFYGGFNHQVQWGGRPNQPFKEKQTGRLIYSFGNDFKSFLNAVTGVSLNTKELNSSIPLAEAQNRAGNHLGSIDVASIINLKKMDLFLYRQSIYEDGSLFFLSNIKDGLFGISLTRKNTEKGIIKICFEYLNTTSQGGTVGGENTIPQLRGNDNYFNNGIYTDAWTYNKKVIGTPFMTSLKEINKSLINNYTLEGVPNTYIVNNRLNVYHFSLYGKHKNLSFLTKGTLSKNFGLYDHRFSAFQCSFIQQMTFQLPQYTLVSSLSIDRGKLYPNNLGVYLGIRRSIF